MPSSGEKISPSQHTPLRKRIAFVMWALMGAAGFGWRYYDSVRKNWSWPVAALLAGIWGVVGVWIIVRLCRNNDTKLDEKEGDGHVKPL
jgi:hypothetical protein